MAHLHAINQIVFVEPSALEAAAVHGDGSLRRDHVDQHPLSKLVLHRMNGMSGVSDSNARRLDVDPDCRLFTLLQNRLVPMQSHSGSPGIAGLA